MTELRIIEMAIKPPFKYFVQKNGHFGGGSIPDELTKQVAKWNGGTFGIIEIIDPQALIAVAKRSEKKWIYLILQKKRLTFL